MAYFGKEFKVVKDDNLNGFYDSLDIPQESKEKLKRRRSIRKITKNADGTYAFSTSGGPMVFKDGVEFEHKFPELTTNITFLVDGNTFTQLHKHHGITSTNVYEFTDNELVETITASNWDGVAKVYYKA